MLNRLLGLLLWAFLTIYPTGAYAESDEDAKDKEDEEEEDHDDSDSDDEDAKEDEEDEEEEDEWGDKFDADRAKKTILAQRESEKKLKEDRKAEKKELAELLAYKKKREDSKKDEITLATESRDEAVGENVLLKQELENTRVRHAIEIRAAKMGFVDPSDAYSLVELDTDESPIKYDAESGKTVGVEKALKALVKEKPYLVEESTDEKGPKGTPLRKIRSKDKTKDKTKAGEAEERAAEMPPVRL